MTEFDSVKYKNEYNKTHYARLSVLVSIDDRPIIDGHWKQKGYKSFNAYVNDLIRKDMNENSNTSNIINQSGQHNTINIK